MRCDICANFEDCKHSKEFGYTISRMEIKDYPDNRVSSLHEELYCLIPKYCEEYIEEV